MLGTPPIDVVNLIEPLRGRLGLYDRTSSPACQPRNDTASQSMAVPQDFIDAMLVREEVFVKEQSVPIENEIDEDDARSFHWVVHVSLAHHKWRDETKSTDGLVSQHRLNSESSKYPAGTIRLVPLFNTPEHQLDKHRRMDGSEYAGVVHSGIHDGKEPFIKLGRLAVGRQFRKNGFARLLVRSALTYAVENPDKLLPPLEPSALVALSMEQSIFWRGLVLAHAQIGVMEFWKSCGFILDEEMGIWDEEGIDHVAMWKRVKPRDDLRSTSPLSLGTYRSQDRS